MNPPLLISPEVQAALHDHRPVVALESTIISHGMPYPDNLETARRVEATVRQEGATPATIAILDGQCCVGLTSEQLEVLARAGQKATKVSRRDFAAVINQKGIGATTVAATMLIAHWAGISVFATGGIGGVHRGAATSMDISADLQELARTPVAVVSAGAKAILDLALTLEYLETMGVPVLGYQTECFPAFFSRESGQMVDYRYDNANDIANFLRTHWSLGLGGVLVANPIPFASAIDYQDIQSAIETAVQEAQDKGISGKAITPFLLGRIVALTDGRSLAANIELVLNNARLAAHIAKAFPKG